ncbi:restriction endonuclease subunit S [Aureispira sp. CCB-E]|uniref:restriction endonuclease subunit S n=1 Tax=Aureispira sp. CCB-E TaxID=3051121 RepID=UPI002868B206|nr:restriction endonuclease subunit S [Aureispira sp. CCB-E]WMX17129.1 restriction endonuclease subunit S [Aureispira sp. CCB-E]
MANWKTISLGEYFDFSSGLSKSADQFGSGYPFLSFKEVFRNYFVPESLVSLVNTTKKEREKCSVRKGDIFLTRTSETNDELGMSCVALKDYPNATFNGFTKRLRPKFKGIVDPIFIGFYLRSSQFRAQISAYSNLSTRASLNNDILERLKLNIPPIDEQLKIGRILMNYTNLIENNNQRIQLLEEMAAEIYKEWFVRFRFPGYESATFVDQEGKEVPHGTDGALPLGWEIQRVKDFGKIVTGKTPSKKDDSNFNGDIPFIKTPDMKQGMFLSTTEETLSKKGANSQSSQYIPKHSIVVSCIGTVGKVGISTKLSQTNQQINSVILKRKMMLEYLYYTLIRMKPMIESYSATGATMANLSKSKFENLKAVKPNQEVIEKFHEVANPMFLEIKILQQKNETLQQTRDLLLPRLISGKLSVENLTLSTLEAASTVSS